jgi:hypothetical protein
LEERARGGGRIVGAPTILGICGPANRAAPFGVRELALAVTGYVGGKWIVPRRCVDRKAATSLRTPKCRRADIPETEHGPSRANAPVAQALRPEGGRWGRHGCLDEGKASPLEGELQEWRL